MSPGPSALTWQIPSTPALPAGGAASVAHETGRQVPQGRDGGRAAPHLGLWAPFSLPSPSPCQGKKGSLNPSSHSGFQAVLISPPEDEFLPQADRHPIPSAQSRSCLCDGGKALEMWGKEMFSKVVQAGRQGSVTPPGVGG